MLSALYPGYLDPFLHEYSAPAVSFYPMQTGRVRALVLFLPGCLCLDSLLKVNG